jgi:thiamine pyrophosphokinase
VTYALVVGAAPAEAHDAFYADLLAGACRVVAADGAGEWCVAAGRVPDVVIGDMDSSAAGAIARLTVLGAESLTFPCDKGETDLELAVDAARSLTDAPIVLTAAFTRRLDHTLAAFGALVRAGEGASARDPDWSAWACVPGHDLLLDVTAGATLSVLALGEARGVTLLGTEWPLSEACLAPFSGLGVSNRATGGTVTVSTRTGTLVVILIGEAQGGLY